MSMNKKYPEKIRVAGVPFALLNGHRAGRGISQGFPDGAPKRRVLDRLPGLLNAAEMRAKGTCEGDSPDPGASPVRGGRAWQRRALMQRPVQTQTRPCQALAYCGRKMVLTMGVHFSEIRLKCCNCAVGERQAP